MSSLFSTVYADASAEEQKAEEAPEVPEEATKAAAEEEEEPEPEDVSASLTLITFDAIYPLKWPAQLHPQIREECQNSPQCAPSTKHYLHCQEKVNNGQGFKGEDCVEEL